MGSKPWDLGNKYYSKTKISLSLSISEIYNFILFQSLLVGQRVEVLALRERFSETCAAWWHCTVDLLPRNTKLLFYNWKLYITIRRQIWRVETALNSRWSTGLNRSYNWLPKYAGSNRSSNSLYCVKPKYAGLNRSSNSLHCVKPKYTGLNRTANTLYGVKPQ